MAKNSGGLVYSTDGGRHCPACARPLAACVCQQQAAHSVTGDGKVRVARETKGRKGAGVTLVQGLPLTQDELQQVAKRLKQKCGVGGAVKNGVIEIQGDKREQIMVELQNMGYQPKRSGG